MKDNKAITLVSLVVTIIVLIILAGVSINLILGQDGIITKAKEAKENTELAKIEDERALNELYMQIETEGVSSGSISYDAIAKLTEFKTAIANYIEEAGGIKPDSTSNVATFGESIKGIVREATKLSEQKAATATDITKGKQAYVNGELITGTAENNNVPYNFCTYLQSNSSAVSDVKVYTNGFSKFIIGTLSCYNMDSPTFSFLIRDQNNNVTHRYDEITATYFNENIKDMVIDVSGNEYFYVIMGSKLIASSYTLSDCYFSN